MNRLILLFILLFLFVCKKKMPIPQDKKWAIESLQMVQKVCKKIISCVDKSEISNKTLNSLIQSQLSEKSCLEKYQKSPIFFISSKQTLVKKNATECFEYMISLSCDLLKRKKFESLNACIFVKKFQSK